MEQKDQSRFGTLIMALVILSGVASLFFVSKTANELRAFRYIGPAGAESNLVYVEGEGEVFVIPDTARFTFAVSVERPTVQAAQESVTETQNNIISYLKQAGVDDNNIKTIGYDIYPVYNREPSSFPNRPGGDTIRGYEVRHTIEVKIKDTQKAGELLSGVGSRGANNISGISFTIEDEEISKREARANAIEDAQEKAKLLSRDLKVNLGPLVRFEEFSSGYPVYFREMAPMMEAGDRASVSMPEIPVGENRVVIRVRLGYEIR